MSAIKGRNKLIKSATLKTIDELPEEVKQEMKRQIEEKEKENKVEELSKAQDEHSRHPNIDNYRIVKELEKQIEENRATNELEPEDNRLVSLLLELLSKKKKFDEAFTNLFEFMRDDLDDLNE